MPSVSPRVRAAILLGLAALYFGAGKLGLSLAFVNASATAVWPPTGIALAALLVLGFWTWPAILVGAFLVNVTTAGNVATSLGIGAGNTLEALAGAWLVRRYAAGPRCFDRVRDVFAYSALGGILAPAIGASIGVACLTLGGLVREGGWQPVWGTWWLGDASGALVVAPLLMSAASPRDGHHLRGRMTEALLLLAATVVAGLAVFGQASPAERQRLPLEFMTFPVLAWAAFRFDTLIAAAVVGLLSSIAIGGTLRGLGPFTDGSPNTALLLLQAFMGVTSVMALAATASGGERRRTAEGLAALTRKLERHVEERTAELSRANQALLRHIDELEQARRDHQEAEASSRLKDQFLATLSHELRTPLSAILGWADLLRRGQLDAEQSDHAVQVIARNAEVQNRLISDILDVSRLAFGRLMLDVRPLDLAPLIRHALDSMRHAAEARGLHVEVELPPTIPVHGDADRLVQVVSNLLSNAIKFTPQGGTVWVKAERRAPSPVDYGHGSVVITVADNGPGISPEFVPHAFERFRQLDSSTTRQQGGLGLGLAIVRHLVELHGGSVEAGNREAGGALLTVTLPLASQATHVPAREPGASGARQLSGVRVLYVDDDSDGREWIATLLRNSGAQVHTAASAGDALAMLERQAPDVLLSDLAMPDESGFGLLRRLRALPRERGGQVPAIAVTALADVDHVHQAIAAGFAAHIAKPVDGDRLVELVRDLANGARSRPSDTNGAS